MHTSTPPWTSRRSATVLAGIGAASDIAAHRMENTRVPVARL
jgi:hypothetical protein